MLIVYQVPLKIMHRQPPKYVFGQKISHVFHQGDVAKLEILLEYGGIYLDYDVIVVNSLDPLRQYSATYGEEHK
jgi:Glycosyltransferase sugar-binding region containing DXD motif